MIYADYCASSPLLPEAIRFLEDRLKDGVYANPNALHSLGNQVLKRIEKARDEIADGLNAEREQVIFTSGSSEGISQVFASIPSLILDKKLIFISAIEHPAVKEAAKALAQQGFFIQEIPVFKSGLIDFSALQLMVEKNHQNVALIAVMAVNNETGVIQPFTEIAQLCTRENILFLCDTTQLIGKMPFDFNKSNIDFAFASGHKLGGLPGSGLLIAKNPQDLRPLIWGGGQENNLRSGTQNYLGSECLSVVLNAQLQDFSLIKKAEKAKLFFEKELKQNFPSLVILGENAPRLPAVSALSLPGIHSQAVQIELESHDIFVTTSAACGDNEPASSHVLKAMGFSDAIGRGVIRISLDYRMGDKHFPLISDALKKIYLKLSKINSSYSIE